MEPEYLRLVKLDKYKKVTSTLWKFVSRFYNRCDVVLTPSKLVVEDLKMHEITKPIQHIANGIDLSFVKRTKTKDVQRIKNRLGLGEHVVLYVGRISQEKNLEVLLDAFREVKKTFDDAQLLIVGDGPMLKPLKEEVFKTGMTKQVIFTGMIPHRELLKSGLFKATHIFCTASTSEVQPISIIEAMAVGMPVVGVDAKGLGELIGRNRSLVEPGDAEALGKVVSELFESVKLYGQASEHSKNEAKSHSIKVIGDEMEELYLSLIQKNSNRQSYANQLESMIAELFRS